MKPLLWKEMRDLRAWLLAGLAMTGTLDLLLHTHVLTVSFVNSWVLVLMPLTMGITALGLGVGQVARERHTRTLEFLLVRPVPASAIVWSKFLAGTIVLLVLLAGAVALCYAQPDLKPDTALRVIREQVAAVPLFATLFPRFWCLYGLTLLFSTLVDRSLKAAVLGSAVTVTLVATALAFADLAPFSGFVFWLPFFEGTGGLVEAAKTPGLSWTTGLVYAAGAMLLTATSGALINRSSERYLGNRSLIAVAAGVIAAGVASAYGATERLPELTPVGTWELRPAGEWEPAGIVTDGDRVAVTLEQSVHFLDFSRQSSPRNVSEVKLSRWRTSAEWGAQQAALSDGTVFLLGKEKSLLVDDLEIARVTAAGTIDTISLGPSRPDDYVSTPVPFGKFVYVGVTREQVCSLLVFNTNSKREVASLIIDRLRPPDPGSDPDQPPLRMVRRGTYLYITSPTFLTAVDIGRPDEPVVTSQVPRFDKGRFTYGFARPLSWQDNHLFEIHVFPGTLRSYDLTDPAHPTARAELTCHQTMRIEGSGHAMYRPWRNGVMEFRAGSDDLQAQRYLRGDGTVTQLAAAGDYVYALTGPGLNKRRKVLAFRVGR